MRTIGSASELERRRRLAVQRVLEGYSTEELADILGVDASSIRRWMIAFRRRGADGLSARPVPGRPRKLSRTQEKIVRRWLGDSPMEHGFDTELWTAVRLAEVIRHEWRIGLNARYLSRWLRTQGFSPQKPERVPRERNPEAIAAWITEDWLRIKKKHAAKGHM
jgi:transposase